MVEEAETLARVMIESMIEVAEVVLEDQTEEETVVMAEIVVVSKEKVTGPAENATILTSDGEMNVIDVMHQSLKMQMVDLVVAEGASKTGTMPTEMMEEIVILIAVECVEVIVLAVDLIAKDHTNF